MKKNNKGFMLVEVIIVTVVVATIMISLYVAFNKVYTAYEEKNNYTNIDGIYALKLIKDDYVNNLKLNDEIKKLPDYNYCKEIEDPEDSSYLGNVFTEYKINKVYLIKTDQTDNLMSASELNQTFKDYIDYLVKKEITMNSDYMLLIEITIDSKNKIYNYAYLEI